MKKGSGTGRTLFLLAGLAAIVVLAYLLWQHHTGSVESPNWDQVHFGHSREAVLELMGEPAEETVEFRLGPRKGHEQIYADAEKSRAVVWLIYHGGPRCTAYGPPRALNTTRSSAARPITQVRRGPPW